MERSTLLDNISTLLDQYESEHPNNNDVGCIVEFFDGQVYVYNGEKLIKRADLITGEATSSRHSHTTIKHVKSGHLHQR